MITVIGAAPYELWAALCAAAAAYWGVAGARAAARALRGRRHP